MGNSHGGGFGRRSTGVCFDWQKGQCNRGDSCRFSHVEPTKESVEYRRSRGVCFDWQKGKCHRGDSCRFAHEESNPTTETQNSVNEDEDDPEQKVKEEQGVEQVEEPES